MPVNTPQKLVVLEREIQQHADTLMTRQLPDVTYARTKFPGGYDQATFTASFAGAAPVAREPANLLCAAQATCRASTRTATCSPTGHGIDIAAVP